MTTLAPVIPYNPMKVAPSACSSGAGSAWRDARVSCRDAGRCCCPGGRVA